MPGHNGRVGQWGISHDGWMTVMGMINPHPAMRAVSPQATTADAFFGDDFHHNGAFIQEILGWTHYMGRPAPRLAATKQKRRFPTPVMERRGPTSSF